VVEVFVGSIFLLGMVGFAAYLSKAAKGTPQIGSAKNPPPFSSSLNAKEVLAVVESRLTSMTSIRSQWKIQEKVERIGRLQAMLNVPYNLNGDNIRISFLLNLLATEKGAGGCNVEWSYVLMAPFNKTPMEVALWENDIYKQTTLEIRSALFSAQGDTEIAEFVGEQARSAGPKEPSSVTGYLEGKPLESTAPEHGKKDLQSEEQPLIATASAPVETESATPEIELTTVSEIPMLSAFGETSNPLNFSPPDPKIFGSSGDSEQSKCVKCNQARDTNFNFCLYCGHVDP